MKAKHDHSHEHLLGAGALLEKHGLKKTEFRLALVRYLLHAEQPQNAQQIFAGLKKKKYKKLAFDRATVFRNLKTLSEDGVLQATEFGTGATHFCLESSAHHHHHVFCTSCQTASPIDFCGIDPMIAKAKEMGFLVTSHRFELLGICKKCR
ncbi:MAG: Fur family transcriptional regulator [Bacteriovoracia bacterium]